MREDSVTSRNFKYFMVHNISLSGSFLLCHPVFIEVIGSLYKVFFFLLLSDIIFIMSGLRRPDAGTCSIMASVVSETS